MMRKYMRPLAVLLFLIINFSSLSAQNAKVIREGSKLFLEKTKMEKKVINVRTLLLVGVFFLIFSSL
jgi:hypothetical protein